MTEHTSVKPSSSANRRVLQIVGLALGVIFLLIAIIYFIQPASGLPGFFPGYQHASMVHHFKHGLAALILSLGCFALAWFSSGPGSAQEK